MHAPKYSISNFQQIKTRFDSEFGVMWSIMQPEPRPCFTTTCLNELLQHQSQLQATKGEIVVQGKLEQVNYFVLASSTPDVFCLGGDLSLFKELILAREKEKLFAYGKLCIENLWLFYSTQAPITTISLVQGQAMGGGLNQRYPHTY